MLLIPFFLHLILPQFFVEEVILQDSGKQFWFSRSYTEAKTALG